MSTIPARVRSPINKNPPTHLLASVYSLVRTKGFTNQSIKVRLRLSHDNCAVITQPLSWSCANNASTGVLWRWCWWKHGWLMIIMKKQRQSINLWIRAFLTSWHSFIKDLHDKPWFANLKQGTNPTRLEIAKQAIFESTLTRLYERREKSMVFNSNIAYSKCSIN